MTPEHQELRRVVRRFLQEASPSEEVRRLLESGATRDERVWSRMAGQLGLQGLVVPEDLGGSGCGSVELGIVLEEMGRAMFVAPYFATVALAAQALVESADRAAQERWLPALAAGELTATLAVTETAGAWSADDIGTIARPDGAGWLLDGAKSFVIDGASADLVLVVARTGSELGLFAVEGTVGGLTRTTLPGLDSTRELAALEFAAAPAARVDLGPDPEAWLASVYAKALAAIAAEQVGGADRCLELAVEHARVREQFGRPIGSFQAVKHTCARLLIEVESARSAATHASAAVAAGTAEAALAATVAKAHCSRTFTQAAKDCIQVHGGIGYTWEHDAHLYLRRAKSSELLFGEPLLQRRRLAEMVGI